MANNVDVKDAAGTTKTVKTTDNASVHTPHVNVDAAVCAGTAAHDAAVSGNPVLHGMEARTTSPTAVADGDAVRAQADATGRAVTAPYSIPENFLTGSTSAITDTTSTAVIAAQAASVRIYVTQVTVSNSHATVGTVVALTDGSGGAVLWRGPAAPAFGGAAATFVVPLKGTAATALHAVCLTTGANVYVSASGYKGA